MLVCGVFILGTSLLSLQSSASLELTEAETEYAVNVVKHIFDRHVVFQYNCTNTIPEQLLENVMPEINCNFLLNHLENCFYNIVCPCRSLLLWMPRKQRNSRKWYLSHSDLFLTIHLAKPLWHLRNQMESLQLGNSQMC